ncbi:MAG: polysaccharide deacetylase family protein [Kiritimatiellae bacterium]|nr:polysaccharide deacetylase family protein [Kiritimatiellia bacterium]
MATIRGLCAAGEPVSMDEIVAASAGKGNLPRRAFAVTFDDGFRNNYTVAAPVLADLAVPATFYVTTGFIEANSVSWTDLIEYAFEVSGPIELSLPFTGACGTAATREEKIRLLDEIRRDAKANRDLDPCAFAGEIWRQLGVTRFEPDPELDDKMSWEQVRTLHQNPLFAVGGHGHTHRVLAYLDDRDLQGEITESLSKLRQCLGGTVVHYSYPEGQPECYSERVIDALRGRGIVCSPSAVHGVNRVGDDLFRLKRIAVV